MRLRSHLVLLTLAALLPALSITATALALYHRQTRSVLERSLLETARTLSLVVDREIGASIAVLQTLATSAALHRGDLREFQRRASLVLKTQPHLENMTLYDPSGQELINLRVPFGSPLPVSGSKAYIREVVGSRAPKTSDIFVGALSGKRIVNVGVPVLREEKVIYVLGTTLSPSVLSDLLLQPRLPPESIGSLVDRNMIFIGRTRAPETFVGRRVPQNLAAKIGAMTENSAPALTSEGQEVLGAFSRSPLTGWTVALGVPTGTLGQPLFTSLGLIVAGGAFLVLVGLGIALLVSRRITSSILELSTAAPALGQGNSFSVASSPIAEVNVVADAMKTAYLERRRAEETTARLLTETERRRQMAASLADVGRLVSASLDSQTVTQAIVDLVSGLLSAEEAALYRLEPDGDRLLFVAGHDAAPFWRGVRPIGGMAGLAVRTGTLVVTPDVLDDPRVDLSPEVRAHMTAAGYRAVLAAPLTVRDRPMGVLVVAFKQDRVFGADEEQLVQGFAAHAATALENARLYQELRAAYEEVSRTHNQLVQAQKMEAIGQLAGGVAHDFNNLLTVILVCVDQLSRQLGERQPLTREVSFIRDAAEQAASLTKQLLAFGRRQMLEPQLLDFNAVVAALTPMLRRALGEHINLVSTPSATSGWVKADLAQLEQVIVNLAINARDAMPQGGRLSIETANVELDDAFVRDHRGASVGPHVALTVRDTGTGMSGEVRAHIFEPFFTTKELGRGTGLGLSTVYGAVKQHGGYIEVATAPGGGTTFRIYLPWVGEVRDAGEASRVRPSALPFGVETVLLVEDRQEVRTLVRDALSRQGYDVLEAATPREALALEQGCRREIDLLLTDVVMPEMSGALLANRLIAARPRLKVLFMSGYTVDAEGLRGSVAPHMTLLEKPFTASMLVSKVREVLNTPRDSEST